ncbi:hypothetical protein, partial [Pseudophaeobacter sp.]|uniref:hypothetical protein n=1 Tax=Pseudophaeobacter sp. TaxID=1971739 RepID=UPI004059D06E
IHAASAHHCKPTSSWFCTLWGANCSCLPAIMLDSCSESLQGFVQQSRVNGEYKLPNMGGETELFATGSAFGSSSDSAKGFAVGLRAKMDRGYNLYAMAGRSYLSSGGHGTTFNLSLVKSFGSNAERVFRRN